MQQSFILLKDVDIAERGFYLDMSKRGKKHKKVGQYLSCHSLG